MSVFTNIANILLVYSIIQNKVTFSVVLDSISELFLTICAPELAPVLTKDFQLFHDNGMDQFNTLLGRSP